MSNAPKLSPEYLERLKGLCEEALDGEWAAILSKDKFNAWRTVETAQGVVVASAVDKDDAAFIAASRGAVPALLSVLESAQAENIELFETREGYIKRTHILMEELEESRARVSVLEEWRGKAFDLLTLAKYEINDGGDHDLAVEIGNFTAEALVDIDAAILREVK